MNDKNLLNVKQLSEKLNIAQSTIYEWVRKRKIPFIKLSICVRFDPERIEEFMHGQMTANLAVRGCIEPAFYTYGSDYRVWDRPDIL